MSTYFHKICYALALLLLPLLHIAGSSGDVKCIEKERQALLNFKQGILDYDSGTLSTWRDDHNNRDCCKWKGVECSNETGHVQKLRLRGSRTHYLSGEFNITSLLELQNVEYLDFSWNHFRRNHIPKHIGSLSNLRYLNLSYMNFGGMIPYQLGNLSRLEYLDLKGNYLEGAIPSQLGNLTQLQYLDLGDNDLSGAIPVHVGNLPMLQTLRLNSNFDLKIIDEKWLSTLPSLTNLDLSGFSHQWVQMISKFLPNLRELRLGMCQLSDNDILSLFNSHSNFSTSLTILDLSDNMLTSSTFQLLSNFSFNLHELYLSDNNIMSFPPNINFPSLVILDLSHNNLTSSVFQGTSNLRSKLKELHLERCYLSDSSFRVPSPSIMNSTSSLVNLGLRGNLLTSAIFRWLFNFTTNLHTLDLGENLLEGPIPNGFGTEMSSKLKELHLESCNLSDSSFRAPSTPIMKYSSSLVNLDLYGNLLTSAIFRWLFNFTTNLHTLDLGENLLEGPIPNGFGTEMSSIEVLSLSENKLQGEVPASLGNICTLRELYLSGNNLSGEMSSFIQNSSRCNRYELQILDLSDNQITGSLPNLSILSSLRQLDLSNNQLIGEMPKGIGLLYELEALFIEGNSLEGDITELHLNNLSNLKFLDLSDNSLSLKFGTTWVPPFQIFNLGLASCKLGPSFPSWLQTQRNLRFIDISDAGINDSVPVWFWNKLQTVSNMNMSYNNLIGTIPNLPLKLTKYYDLHVVLNSNQFEGRVPTFLSQASTVDLSNNNISDLDLFLCGKITTTNMRTLDFSDNQIKGPLSDCWGHLNSLAFLDLSNNKLSGKIPPSLATLFNLEALVLRNNSFIGELPSTLKNCSNLVILDMSDNLLSGSIPSWIGESLQQLKILSLRVNHFFGTLPSHLCYLWQIRLLDVSRNNLSGSIPTCLKNFTEMVDKSIDLKGIFRGRLLTTKAWYVNIYESNVLLSWKGQEYVFKNPEVLLKSIDLSSNQLSGEVPTEIGQLLGLVSLNLSRNKLSGEIPSDIGNLDSLEFLDLSRNHLSGRIPSTLSQIDRLGVLDLSNNALSGKIPLGTQLQSFDPSSFEANLDLCGKPLEKSCPGDETPIKPQGSAADDKDGKSVFYEALYMSMGIGFFTGFWGLIGSILLWKPWKIAYLKFLDKLTLKMARRLR